MRWWLFKADCGWETRYTQEWRPFHTPPPLKKKKYRCLLISNVSWFFFLLTLVWLVWVMFSSCDIFHVVLLFCFLFRQIFGCQPINSLHPLVSCAGVPRSLISLFVFYSLDSFSLCWFIVVVFFLLAVHATLSCCVSHSESFIEFGTLTL